MANIIATNFGEFTSLSDWFDSGTGAGGSFSTAEYSSQLGWPNGNGRVLLMNSSGITPTKNIPAASEYYVHLKIAASLANDARIINFNEGATNHIQVVWQSGGTIQVLRNGTVLATGATLFSHVSAIDVQVRAKIDDSVGVVQVRVNGSTSNEINFSGDTRNGGTGVINSISWVQLSNTVYISDLVVNDTTGSDENSWTGAVRVVLGVPTAAGASGTQFTPSASTNVSNIDDAIPGLDNADTDYNEDSTAGHKDWFTWPSSVFTGMSPSAIHFVRTKYRARAADAGSHTMRSNSKSGGTTTNGTTINLGSSYALFEDVFYKDPSTAAAWASFAAITGAEFGYELVS